MTQILHKLNIASPAARVFQAIASREGLANWWTSTTAGVSAPGETLTFRFNDHVIQMRVTDLAQDRRVVWECTQSDPDWVGTQLTFDLTEEQGQTTLRFGHHGWREEASDFLSHCSFRWATFLLSLREFVETGKGRPFPCDLRS